MGVIKLYYFYQYDIVSDRNIAKIVRFRYALSHLRHDNLIVLARSTQYGIPSSLHFFYTKQ